jgi:hypothetical protein
MKPAKVGRGSGRARRGARGGVCGRHHRARLFGRQREIRELAPRVITGDAWRVTPSGRVLNHEPILEPGDCQREQMSLRGFALLNEAGDQVAIGAAGRDRDRPQPAVPAAAQHHPFLAARLPGGGSQWPTFCRTKIWSRRISAGRTRSRRSGRRSKRITGTPRCCAIPWPPAASTAAPQIGPKRNYNFDSTAIEGLDRFDAALGAVTMPKTERWLGLTVYDKDLARSPAVQRWLEHASDRVWDCMYAPHANFGTACSEDRRSLGCYGTGALWVDESKGKGLFFRALHMSENYIDVDFRGQVDTDHRKFELTARQAAQMFGATI